MSRAEWYKDLGSFVLRGTGEYPETRQEGDKPFGTGLYGTFSKVQIGNLRIGCRKIFGHRAEAAAPAAENVVTFPTPERA
jgi:hypothetical protein